MMSLHANEHLHWLCYSLMHFKSFIVLSFLYRDACCVIVVVLAIVG